MSLENKGFQFGEFFLDPDERLLKRDGELVSLTPKAFDLLLEFIKRPAIVLTKDTLMDSVWAGSIVEDGNLTFTMNLLRKAIQDDAKVPKFIETIPRRGYRFIAPVVEIDGNDKRSAVPIDDAVFAGASVGESSDLLVVQQRLGRRYLFFGALTFIALTLAVVFWGIASKLRTSYSGPLTVKHITTNGETKYVSTSPNGQFLAYILDKGDHQSLWLYNVATESDVMLSPAETRDSITNVAFAPDGEHIFYISSSKLFRIPILGGKPELIVEDVNGGSNVTISPDGKKAAFLRSADVSKTDIIVVDLETRVGRVLLESQRPRQFYSRLAWSPDGRSIAAAKRGGPGEGLAIVVLNADDGTEIQKFKMIEVVSDLIWKFDGTAILTAAYRSQISRILQYDLSGGNKPTTLTDDLVSYTSLTMSSDGSRLFAVREETGANLSIIPANGDAQPARITTGFNRFDGLSALAWIAPDRVMFNAQPREEGETDSVLVDGGDLKLVSKSYSDGISPDGHYLIRGPSHAVEPVINVVDTLNGNIFPIASGYTDINHTVSLDGQWTAFTRLSDDIAVWRVSMSGGDPVRLSSGPERAQWPAISPDGRFVAFYRPHVDPDGKFKVDIAYVDSNGGSDIKRFAVDAQLLADGKTAPQWSGDGRSIYFVRLRDGASNIWKQPIDGLEPTQVTHLKSGRIYNFMLSPDETQAALSYGPFSRDVVQITFR